MIASTQCWASVSALASSALAVVDPLEIDRRVEFEALPGGWARVAGLLLAAAILGAVVWMYRREGRAGASMRARMILAGIRCGVLAVLIAIWLEPVVATYVTRRIESYCLLMVDDSASMDLKDLHRGEEQSRRVAAVTGETPTSPVRRADLAQHLLTNDDHRLLRKLTERNRVRLQTFADSLETVCTLEARRQGGADPELAIAEREDRAADATDGPPFAIRNPLVFSARGSATNAALALRRATQQLDDSPIAGVVLLTDGGFTEPDAYEAVAALAREQRLPLHVVGLGDPSPPRNVRVVELAAPESAFERDPFQLIAQLSATGFAGTNISVELYERPADGSGDAVRVEARQIIVQDDGPLEAQTFTCRPKRVGRWLYRVEVPIEPTELIADDNRRQTTVNVIDARIRVLLVAGGPSWDYRYLSRLLERDDAFDVSCWLQSADVDAVRDGNTIIDHLPTTAPELFAYDAIILLDPDPDELTQDWCRQTARLVTQYGGGLLYAAARMHTPGLVHDERVRPLLDLLPVALDPEADLILNRIGHYQQHASPTMVPDAALSHPVFTARGGGTRGDAAPFVDRLRQGAGEIYWHYPVLREKPVATALLRHADPRMVNSYGPHVLAAVQFAGAGRTAFLAFDGSWRWRRYGEEVFDGFWVRLLRHLVEGKLLGTKKRGLILTDRDDYQLGAAVAVQARVYDEQFAPLSAGHVELSYSIDSLTHQFDLQAAPDRPGWFEGRFVPDRVGSYEITLELPGAGQTEGLTIRRLVQVSRPNLEILHPRMMRDAMVSLAATVDDGRYYEMDEAAQLWQAIPDRHESITVRSRPAALWDSGWTLFVLVGLLSLEWGLRKWARLL
ncbi:MAG TPA: hypothetical protein VM243_03150 [Phycisphaerae bacterium]|nr:hypothetical protein [Phycisphaerae bacterium]